MTTPGSGPVCEFCDTGEPAVLSLMKLDDYSNARVGAACAPAFLRGVADLMDGGQAAAGAILAAGDGSGGAPGVVPAPDPAGPGLVYQGCACGHPYQDHSFYGADRAECHECDCGTYQEQPAGPGPAEGDPARGAADEGVLS